MLCQKHLKKIKRINQDKVTRSPGPMPGGKNSCSKSYKRQASTGPSRS